MVFFTKTKKLLAYNTSKALCWLFDKPTKTFAKKGVSMLVLTRKLDESVTIRCPDGNLIKISVCRIDGNFKVRLGIDANQDYKITRTELIEKSNLPTEEFFNKF